MKTRDCVKHWVNLLKDGDTSFKGRLVANSCRAWGAYFMSYDTPIAHFCGDHFELATQKYSVTTTKQQNYLRFFIPKDMLVEVETIQTGPDYPGYGGYRPWTIMKPIPYKYWH